MINQQYRALGFTLIELLIAITILSLLLFTGSFVYSSMSDRWTKELGQFSQTAKRAKHLELLQRLLEGVQPFVVTDEKQIPSFFFIGGEDSLLAVSRSGVFSGNFPEIFRLTTVKKENGLVDLVYQSASTETVLLIGTSQSVEFSKKVTLFSDLNKISLNYFGWSHYRDKSDANETGKTAQWYSRYSGIENQIMPEMMTLSLEKAEHALSFQVYLDSDSERWLSPYINNEG